LSKTPTAEPQNAAIASKLNWLRAGVLGANDGIVSTAALIFGVAGAAAVHSTIVLAGIAAIAAGAMSMAVGEYVSVSSQRDLEEAELAREREQIAADPDIELQQLTLLLEGRGIEHGLAEQVAVQLTERDALAAHARVELGIDPSAVVNPIEAALASMLSFTVGGLVPLLAMVLAPRSIEIWISGMAVVLALVATGAVSAWLGRSPRLASIVRTVAGGLIAMAVTYGIGKIAGGQL
jgi:VIT1/CCC1 family predicted Fe2+/Mn2+ transporter